MSIGKHELQTKLILKVVIPLPQLDQAWACCVNKSTIILPLDCYKIKKKCNGRCTFWLSLGNSSVAYAEKLA